MLKHLAPEDLAPSDLERAHQEIRLLTKQLRILQEQHRKLDDRYLSNRMVLDRIAYSAFTLAEAQAWALEAWRFGPVAEEGTEDDGMEGYPG